MIDPFVDKIRGMLLLGAYGDALGAQHETEGLEGRIASAPFPQHLPVRPMATEVDGWDTWVPHSVLAAAAGIPTDDSCYRFFLLHPWLEQIAQGKRQFSEQSLQEFLPELRETTIEPSWIQAPRNAQIDGWLNMFSAARGGSECEFYAPNVPVVFGLFMYLEAAAVLHGNSPIETYQHYRKLSKLDQKHASCCTGLLATLVSLAIHDRPETEAFDLWFYRTSSELVAEIEKANIDPKTTPTLSRLLSTMSELGEQCQGKPEWHFAATFKEQVIEVDCPAFTEIPFSGTYDPLWFLACITAAIQFSAGNPYVALRCIAFGVGDADTMASCLGTLMGAWFGEYFLRAYCDDKFEGNEQLCLIEAQLQEVFAIDLASRIELFQALHEHSKQSRM